MQSAAAFRADAHGVLRQQHETGLPPALVTSDLRLRQAFTRRGVAFEVADVLNFKLHETFVDKMFMEYQRDPMPGYAPVSLAQIAAADKRAFKMLQEMLVHGLGRDADGNRHADVALPQIVIQPNWLQMLTPLPSLSRGSSTDRLPHVADEIGGTGKRKLRRENDALKAELRNLKSARTQGPKPPMSSGKSKGK
eukprot:3463363-Amphidinium_carterae.1